MEPAPEPEPESAMTAELAALRTTIREQRQVRLRVFHLRTTVISFQPYFVALVDDGGGAGDICCLLSHLWGESQTDGHKFCSG